MSAATIAEPFLLSSYPESSAYRKRKVTPLYASLPSGSNADPFVAVAVQGDGIHVLDTSTLHSAASHTLGPSTSFSCPPALRTTQARGDKRTCTTFAVLESGPDVQPEGKGKTVVVWEEELSGGLSTDAESERKKRAAIAPHTVAHLYAPDYLPQNVVLVDSSGVVTVTDEDIREPRSCSPHTHQPSSLIKHFLFPASSCSFLSGKTDSAHVAISVSFLRSGEILRLAVVGVGEENVVSIGECVVPVDETDIVDISCSNTGFIGILLASGTMQALSLTATPSASLSISPAGEPLRLQNLTFVNTTRTSEACLVALTSSHAVLCAISTGSVPEIVFLLWDLRYGVLLAQQSMPVPITLARPKKHGAVLRMQVSPGALTGTSKTTAVTVSALLTLLPHPEREHQADKADSGSTTAARSTVLAVPITVPAASTIAAAMGKAQAGARWVAPKTAQGAQAQGQPARGAPEMSGGARKALREIRTAIQGSASPSPAAAEGVFFDFVKKQSKSKGASGEGVEVPLEYPFVQGVLELVLPRAASSQAQGKNPVSVYSPKIVKYLLDARTVNSSMVPGGLLPALAAESDWDMVSLAMKFVTDLPENDIISLLSQVVAAHRRTSSSGNDDAMQVDASSPTTPSLAAFLAQCVAYPTTPALQRAAIRKHLPEAADLLPILETLDGWIAQDTADADALFSTPAVPASAASGTNNAPPPLDKTLAFAQTLLDASFLALLAHTPAHAALRALAAHITPALARAGELEALCGPLEPFARKARAQAEAPKDGAGKTAAAVHDGGRDWRRKRKAALEQAGMAVGLYQVEELVL